MNLETDKRFAKTEVDIVEVTKTFHIDRFEYKVVNMELNKNISLLINLFSDTTFIKVSMLIIEGELYDSWGENDEYIVDIIKRNIRKLAECSSSVIAE
tara:strand:+ start:1930 stop:2223 length:294 start_codon:yes stop_codon:yes gene_type:complete